MEKTKKKRRTIGGGEDSAKRIQRSLEARELASKDDRFSSVYNNPIYRPVPKKEKKIDIDKRFRSMFHDDKFKLKYKVDKRGGPVNSTTDENLMKYYNLVDTDDDDDDDDDEQEEETAEIKEEIKSEESSSSSADEDIDPIEGEITESEITKQLEGPLSLEIKKKLHDINIDYARGEGAFLSEESTDEETSESEDDAQSLDHEWGELDKDAPRTEESTKRLALCNMDWDRLKVADLMVLFNSFLPSGGILKKIAIYPSEFGKKRMAEEDLKGPLELAQFKKEMVSDEEEVDESADDGDDRDDEDDEDEGASFQREKLRSYQLNRLKYFYAVLEFDSIESAEKVYNECDGIEYESSAAKIDLRYIPEDMVFNETPKAICESLPDSNKYRPKFFTTTALQQVKVHCTWDETDPTRKDLIEKVFNPKEKIDDEDIRAYLASSSSDSEDESIYTQSRNQISQIDSSTTSTDPISKYRALLESIDETEKNKKRKDDVELEITWGVGLKQKTEELVKKKLDEKEKATLTPWEEYMVKKKEKKKQTKSAKKIISRDENSDSSANEDDDQPFSDDDVDVDMNDPFFKQELATNEVFKKQNKSKLATKEERKGKKKQEIEDDPKSSAELELLLMDEDEGKKHFSLKKIIQGENESKSMKKRKFKKHKKRSEKDATISTDDFKVDVKDERFSALFTSHHFNIDPSEPSFKRTKGMDIIVSEKHDRRITNKAGVVNDSPPEKLQSNNQSDLFFKDNVVSATNRDAELSCLVKSIKRNTQNQNLKKKKMNMKSKN